MLKFKSKVSPEVERLIQCIENEPENWSQGSYTFFYGKPEEEYMDRGQRFQFWVANGYSCFRLYSPEIRFQPADKKALWKAIQRHSSCSYTSSIRKFLDVDKYAN